MSVTKDTKGKEKQSEREKGREKQQLQLDKLSLLREYFEWIRILGEGSFGKVYLVRNKHTKKEYALKQYHRSRLQRHKKFRSLVRSIYILHRLRHPNIIRCVNYIVSPDQDGTIYLIFDACKKGSLADIKKDLTTCKLYAVISFVLLQLAEGLSYLKTMKVAHRDIKPQNICFNSAGELKIIDFDEAVCFDQQFPNVSQVKMLRDFVNLGDVPVFFKSSKGSRASNFVGTQFYMSPEMIQNTICDEKGDLWAFACIFYELIVGDYLHIQFDSEQLFEKQLSLRLSSFTKSCGDASALDLFKKIAKYSPAERIEIQSVLTHPYFKEVSQPSDKEQAKQLFIRFLRLNYNVSKEKSYSISGIDGIDLPQGLEIYRQAKTIILVRFQQKFEFYQLISGPSYFKFKNVTNSRSDFYVNYNKIDRVVKVKDLLHMYFYSLETQGVIEMRAFKHLYPNMLEQLNEILQIIIKD